MIRFSRSQWLQSLSRVLHRYKSTLHLYITSPIFYVNAKPHLGHAYTMLLCDVRARWQKLNPRGTSYFLTGTDEHGLKIQTAAEKGGRDPQEFVNEVSENFKTLAQRLNVQYDRFIRTTDPDHVDNVRSFWESMMKKGFIYKGSHSGWYSVSDETFYPESQIEEVQRADGERVWIASQSKSEVSLQQETNYFFKLSQFQDRLIEHLETTPNFIIPRSRQNDLLEELKHTKLSDLSVSRPSSRLSWSIEVPNDPSQKIYVWFDALLNYLTAAGFPQSFETTNGGYTSSPDHIWPPTHIVGKDIMKFHCIYWPIFLMAAGIELPKQVLVHSHWTSEGLKMSKSIGNVVDPIDTLHVYGEDAFRFFLAEYSNLEHDSNFLEAAILATHEKLISKYANLASRVGGTNFSVKELVRFWSGGKFHGIEASLPKDAAGICKATVEAINSTHASMDQSVKQFDYKRAISGWWRLVETGNEMFQKMEPWVHSKALRSKDTPESDKETCRLMQNYLVFLGAELVRVASILLQSIAPQLGSKVLDRLGVDSQRRSFDYALLGADLCYGNGANAKGHPNPLDRIEPPKC